jgi:hypothetical protein
MCAAVANSRHQVDVEFLHKGLHDSGSRRMLETLQGAVDATDTQRYSAVLMGYALCGNGLVGLTAREIPVVIPRAHDCITLFLGSRDRYLAYFHEKPGTYFRTTGWIERANDIPQFSWDYNAWVEKYGEENARYLQDEMVRQYRRLTFIEMGVEPDDSFAKRAEAEAAGRGWEFEKLSGDMSLIRRLVNGEWDSRDFLVVQPGQRVVARYDDSVIDAA